MLNEDCSGPLVLPAAGLAAIQRGNCHYYFEFSLLYSGIRRGFYSRAVPSGAAGRLRAHHPAGKRGDIQAVTHIH